jgi:hypothetical protein
MARVFNQPIHSAKSGAQGKPADPPMPLMPTGMAQGSLYARQHVHRPSTDLVEAGPDRHAIEFVERKIDENRDAPVQAGIELVQHCCPFGAAAGEFRRIRQRP